MLELILVYLTSFGVALYATPALIRVAILKRLTDVPVEDRKIHKRSIPTVGGIIIYAATMFSFALWYKIEDGMEYADIYKSIEEFKLIIATSLVLFFVGVKDDIIGTAAVKKLFAHILVALILVLIGNIRITSLYGVFGVWDIPYWASVFVSLFTYVVVVNAFNLIDGVDFLVFNFSPAKIFMGDSGSLIIGLFVCILAIKLIEFPVERLDKFWVHISKPVFVIAAMIYPLLDTLRVFIIRTLKGQSPLVADKNHIHHHLIERGYSHVKTVIIIYGFTIVTIGLSLLDFFIRDANIGLIVLGGIALLFLFFVLILNRKHAKVS
ncbi:MAG: undecaprenyl/decaprenyl-phosphate alpha-N-acetylglucosaminyl 1-phosphate transferase [Sphingobacteriaceae bacterium]|nr:undecaprenyl/decaprenyl-phosphate alpha-N-acetylglucosaminyl 1-phosphate transferase [Sphingobacteriaceae bacterium]